MKLKRHYDPASIGEGKTPRVTHVEVIHTGLTADQNFDDGMIDKAVLEGWASLSADTLTLKTDGEPLVYAVKRAPGYFCKSTGERIPVSDKAWYSFRYGHDSTLSRAEALSWLAAHGKAENDYDIAVAYHCELSAGQHAKFRAVTGAKGETVAAHTLEA